MTKITRWSLALIAVLTLVECRGSSSNSDSSANLGSAGGSYLAAAPYSSLLIEIQVMTGFGPAAGSISNLVSFMNAYLNKPGGVTYVVETIPALGQSSYSIDDANAIEAAHRQSFSNGTQAVAYFLFVDGPYSGNSGSSSVLGVAHSASSIMMFEKSIQSLSGGLGQPSRVTLETTVMNHEFGHLLGLVNVGTPMQTAHQDTAHGAHCSQTSCLMYWQVDTSDFVANLLGGSVPTLDADCVADLRARGGK